MKKLSLIVALAVVLTIGGVFATWTYNDGSIASVSTIGSNAIIADADTEGLQGTISFEGAMTFNVHNANPSGKPEQYAPVFAAEGEDIVVTIDISNTAPAATRDGVTLQYQITCENNDGIFTVDSAVKDFDGNWKDGESVILTKDMVEGLVTANAAELDTAAKHSAYATKVKNVVFKVTFSVKAGS